MDEKSRRSLAAIKTLQEEHLCCPICTISLSEPVYECKNGHIICKPCLDQLQPAVCPSCRCDLSDPHRCRAIEQQLEVVPLACQLKNKMSLLFSSLFCFVAFLLCPSLTKRNKKHTRGSRNYGETKYIQSVFVSFPDH